MCLPLVSRVFVVFLQPHCSWRLLLASRITSQDCIAVTPAHCGPARKTFRHKSWPERHLEWEEQCHGVCKSIPGHGNTMKYISKTKGRYWASFTSYCFGKVDNKRQRAIETKECERQNETKWPVRQKRNTKKYILGNKRMWAWMQREPRRSTKESRWRRPGASARNKRKSKDTAALDNTKPLEKAWH